MVLGFEKIIDSTMDIDTLNLANLVGEVMDEIVENHCVDFVDKLWIIRDLFVCTNKSNCDKTSCLLRSYLASLATNVKMLKCVFAFCRYHDVKIPCIALFLLMSSCVFALE